MATKPTADELLASLSRHPKLLFDLARKIQGGEVLSSGSWEITGRGKSSHIRTSITGEQVAKVKRVSPGNWEWSVFTPDTPRIGGTTETADQAQGLADEVLMDRGYNLCPPIHFPKYASSWEENHIHGSVYCQRRDRKGNALASIVVASSIPETQGTLYMGTDPEDMLTHETVAEARKTADRLLKKEGWILR